MVSDGSLLHAFQTLGTASIDVSRFGKGALFGIRQPRAIASPAAFAVDMPFAAANQGSNANSPQANAGQPNSGNPQSGSQNPNQIPSALQNMLSSLSGQLAVAANQSGSNRSAANQPAANQPAANQPAANQPAARQQPSEANRPQGNQSGVNTPPAESQPAAAQPASSGQAPRVDVANILSMVNQSLNSGENVTFNTILDRANVSVCIQFFFSTFIFIFFLKNLFSIK